MEILKPNDILIATLNNPQVTPYDLLSNNINGENTSLFSKDKYKESEYIQKEFTGKDGKFDDQAFDKAYTLAQNNYFQLTNEEYLKGLDQMSYSPFDITRPKFAKTFKVSSTLEREYNPFKEKHGWTGIGSVDASDLSLRELAQQSKIYDPKTKTWSDKSINDLSIMDKLFGDTYVYAQYDEDGQHEDPRSLMMVEHKKGDWKVSEDGDLFVEKLAGREIYGKQVVNPMDTLTTDGSVVNQFDFFDSDGREKSIVGSVFKLAVEIAPFLIPNFGVLKGIQSIPNLYGGLRAVMGLTSIMPTFYKSFEGILVGDRQTTLTNTATQLEGYLAKFSATSTSDAASSSLFNSEQLLSMVGDIFSQIHEQRAMASLAQMIYKGDKAMNAATKTMAEGINKKLFKEMLEGKISVEDIPKLSQLAMSKIPELQSVIKSQSQLSKALSLGYMALTSTADIYGEAIEGGYDRRTAGFASLAAAAGQYGIMMNNRMGDWFLDKTTGYNTNVNTALIRKGVTPWLDEVAAGIKEVTNNTVEGKKALASTFGKIKNSLQGIFTDSVVIGEAMWKNAFIEGVEEVTEQVVMDATKGMIDTMSFLGLTKKQGTFGGWENTFSKNGFENYLANFIGGVIGGGMFEYHRAKIAPWLDPTMLSAETQKSFYELIAGGHQDEVIKVINSRRGTWGNKYITPANPDGTFKESSEGLLSQDDLISDKAINMVNIVTGIFNNHDLIHSDEDIIMRTLMDQMIINDLNKTKPEGKQIGIEGIVLEDYKNQVAKIVQLESSIRTYEAGKEEGKIFGTTKGLQVAKEELKTVLKNVEDMLEGKKGLQYYTEAMVYLNKDIHKALLNISKNDFVKEKYDMSYADLPALGDVGISQESVDAEWAEFISTKNLRKDIGTATKLFLNIEGLLNGPISKYAEKGYDAVRKETFKNIIDLKATIDMFNVADTPEKKQFALNRFIQMNNDLTGETMAPWNVLHNNIHEQIKELGLIKKITYATNEDGEYIVDKDGKLIYETSDFTPEELAAKVNETEFSKEEVIKDLSQRFFKEYALNPMNISKVIFDMEEAINITNKQKLLQIKALEEKQEPLTENEQEKLIQLQQSLQDFTIIPITQSLPMQEIRDKITAKLDDFIAKQNIKQEELNEYRIAKERNVLFETTFNEKIDKVLGTTGENWKDLDLESFRKLISEIIDTGLYGVSLDNLTKISKNAEEEIVKLFAKLESNDITDDEFKEVKEGLEPFMNGTENMVNKSYALLKNNAFKLIEKEEQKYQDELDENLESVLPDLFKIQNYALDLLLKELGGKNVDNEVFLEAEQMVEQEITKFTSLLFPESKNVSYEDLANILEAIPHIISELDQNFEDEIAGIPDVYESDKSIKNVFEAEAEMYKTDPNYKGIFFNKKAMDFIENSIDGDSTLQFVKESLKSATKAIKSNKFMLDRITRFFELEKKGINLVSNSFYDFIREFSLTLDSDPKSKVNKIFEIYQREEANLRAASNITNFMSDNIREQDVDQAINVLKLIKAVVKGMSTTEVSLNEPYGFLKSRQDYAKKYGSEEDISNLKTITSDIAELTTGDIDLLLTKLEFFKELTAFNAGKRMNEEEITREKVHKILLTNWQIWASKMNVSFLPSDKVNAILNSDEDDEKKLVSIEDLVFSHNITKQSGALDEFLKWIGMADSNISSQIDNKIKKLEAWDLAVYAATILSSKASDFQARSFWTLSGDFKKAPFFTQEFAARVVKASTVNPMLFKQITDTKLNSSKTDSSFITYILGNSGTGKTSAVFGLDLDNFRQTNEMTNIWAVAPDNLQRDNLEKAIIESVGPEKLTINKFNKKALFERLNLTRLAEAIEEEIRTIRDNTKTRKYVKIEGDTIVLTEDVFNNKWVEEEVGDKLENLPNLLLIDEITHFSAFDLHLLNALSVYSFNSDNLNFMKIIGAGDPSQLGYMAEVESEGTTKYYTYSVGGTNGIFTPKLWASIRTSNTQQRINQERYLTMTKELERVYNSHGSDYAASEAEALAYLEANKKTNAISYYQSDTQLAGAKIVTDLNKELVNILAKIKLKTPDIKIGILTEDGEIPEEWNILLSNAGIITPEDDSAIVKFNPRNVQGSEVNYFIFDAAVIERYDKIRDNVKAFYTFVTRSRDASIIIDKKDILKKYSIANGKPDTYSRPYEFLTDAIITTAKEARIATIKKLIGEDPTPSEHDNFKWKTPESLKEEEVIVRSKFVTDDVPSNATEEPTEQELTVLEDKILEKDFKILSYSFYNNPNAIIDPNTKAITVDPNNPNTDLNFVDGVVAAEGQKVINSWLALKNHLLNNKGIDTLVSTEFIDFFKHAFNDISESSAESIGIEMVLTLSKYNREYNNPYAKHGFDLDKTLENGDLFINLSAKLSFGQKVHYVTIASLGTEEKIVTKALELNIDPTKISERFAELKTLLENSDENLITLKIDDLDSFDLYTKTKLKKIENPKTKKPLEYKLSDLSEQFPGMRFSEIRFFPQSIEAFKQLLRKYTFKTERWSGQGLTDAQIDEKYTKLFLGYTDAKGTVHPSLKNKPYIVASTKNDLAGSETGLNTQATLIVIGSHSRKLDVLTEEINNLLEERKKEVSANYRKDPNLSSKNFIGEKINAKTETLLNRSEILDVLIKWGSTPHEDGTLLDLLFKDIEFSISDTVTGNKTSVFEIFSRFKTVDERKSKSTNAKLKKVIEATKKAIARYGGEKVENRHKLIKAAVMKEASGQTFWHWTFFNIFAYKQLIKSTLDPEFKNLLMNGQMDQKVIEAFNNSTGGTEMVSILETLMQSLHGYSFHYSIPIKPSKTAGGALEANSHISGTTGFSTEMFGDKFFIGVAPESPNLLLNLETFLTAEVIPSSPVSISTKTAPAKATQVNPTVTVPVTTVTNPAVVINQPIILNPMTTEESQREDLILHALSSFTEVEIIEKLGDTLRTIANSPNIASEFINIVKQVLESEVYELLDTDYAKTKILIEAFDFTFSNGKIDLKTLAPTLGLDKLADKDTIMEFRKKINELLTLCK